jgi:hypothetical protein
MNTAQLTPRAQAVIAASDEYTAPIFRAPSFGPAPISDDVLEAMRAIIPLEAWDKMDYNHLRALYAAARPTQARFPSVSCSSCGKGFGPGNEGFSHCDDHERIAATAATGEAL